MMRYVCLFWAILANCCILATPLTEAVKQNDLVTAEKLLQNGADVNQRDTSGYTPLMIASGLGNYQMTELLLTAGADVHILDTRMGASALHKAAQGGVVPVAELLLKRGAFIDLQAPTHGHTPLIDAVWHRKPQIVEYLLSQGADWEIVARDGTTARIWAEWGNHQDILLILDRYEQKKREYIEVHPIFKAIEANEIETVKKIIAQGIDIDHKAEYRITQRSARGITPLLLASMLGHVQIAQLLLEAGANPRIVDWLMKSTVVHKSGYMGRPQVIPLILQKGAEIDAQGPYNGYTALHDAVWHGHLEAAQALIAGGAKLQLRGHDGKTPRDLAIQYGYPEIARVIQNKIDEQLGLIEVAHANRQWTGVAVSPDERIFVNYPRWSDDVPVSVVEIMKNGTERPYPNAEINYWRSGDSPQEHFVCVQSVVADEAGNLWVLDPANPKFQGVVKGGPKLIEIDLKTDTVLKTYSFDSNTAPDNSYLNDVRIDFTSGIAYITDSGLGAILVVDLKTGKSRRLLEKHHSTRSEDIVLTIEGHRWFRPDGSIFSIHSDGIALTPDKHYLYYQSLTSRSLYRIATKWLRDEEISQSQLADKVEFVAKSGVADGLEFDKKGNLYISSLEYNAIRRLTPENILEIVVQDDRISWPDSFAISKDGTLYFTTSQIHLGNKVTSPYRLFKIFLLD